MKEPKTHEEYDEPEDNEQEAIDAAMKAYQDALEEPDENGFIEFE